MGLNGTAVLRESGGCESSFFFHSVQEGYSCATANPDCPDSSAPVHGTETSLLYLSGKGRSATREPTGDKHTDSSKMRCTRIYIFLLNMLLRASARALRSECSVEDFGAVGDNATDNTAAFRRTASECHKIIVPRGTWITAPFNLSSHTILHVIGTISGSSNPQLYPIVTQQPLDEAYRAPWMQNRQRQALISAYSAVNVTLSGSGTVDGNGWDW